MKILIDSYNCVAQNPAGGIQIRIKNYINNLKKYTEKDIELKLFDKWNDKITDYDLLHIFKANIEDFQLVEKAKSINMPVVISSIVPLEKSINIKINSIINKILPIHTAYWFMNQILKKADAILSQTKAEADFISNNYKICMEKIYVIPNGVNIKNDKKYDNYFKEKTGINDKYILQVGRFDKNKNQLNVIKAMKNSEIKIVFIGGPDPHNINYYKKCQEYATKNIIFLGWIENNDPLLYSAYKCAHSVILPSFKEIFGNSLIEGGAAGANLIATKELPIKEWGIKKYCKIIDPSSPHEIKNKIIESLNEPKDDKLSSILRDKFSWKNVVIEHKNIYKKLISNK